MKKSILVAGMFLFVAAANAQTPPAQTKTTGDQQTITPQAAPNPNAGDFKFQELEYNFGTIKQGDKVDHDFNFTNDGKEPIIISEAHGSCGCTVPQWPKE